MRIFAALVLLALIGCAALASNSHKPFPLLIDEAHATIICNPVLTPGIAKDRKVQKV